MAQEIPLYAANSDGETNAEPSLPVAIFVVSLVRATDRWAAIEPSLVASGQPWQRVEAMDAKTSKDLVLGMRGLNTADDGKHPFQCDPKLVGGQNYAVSEEACFLSHLTAIRTFLKSGQPFGLIIEDDAVLPADLFEPGGPVALCIDNVKFWDAVRLEGSKHRGERLAFIYGQSKKTRLVGSLMPSSNAGAYLLTREGARRLIRKGINAIEPFDTFLVDVGRHHLRVLDLSPYPVHQQIAQSYNDVVPKGRDFRSRLARSIPKLRRHVTRLIYTTAWGIRDLKWMRKCRWR